MKTETWLGHQIRFVEKEPSDWWAVAKDVSDALDYDHTPHMMRLIDPEEKGVRKVDTLGGKQKLSIISEFGIYDAIFGSHKTEAKEFKHWVKQIIKQLRKSSGLAGFEVFRLLDKEEQRKQMSRLSQALRNPVRVDFIKANTIANKAVSTRHGYPKMVRKKDMLPEMLIDREPILQDVVDLMSAKERFSLDVSVSKAIYSKYGGIS